MKRDTIIFLTVLSTKLQNESSHRVDRLWTPSMNEQFENFDINN
jgi:hypothetical protein